MYVYSSDYGLWSIYHPTTAAAFQTWFRKRAPELMRERVLSSFPLLTQIAESPNCPSRILFHLVFCHKKPCLFKNLFDLDHLSTQFNYSIFCQHSDNLLITPLAKTAIRHFAKWLNRGGTGNLIYLPISKPGTAGGM